MCNIKYVIKKKGHYLKAMSLNILKFLIKNHSFVFRSFTISSCLSLGIDMYWWNSIE